MGELREDQNEAINNRLEEQEPAGLAKPIGSTLSTHEYREGRVPAPTNQELIEKSVTKAAETQAKKRAAGKKVVQGKVLDAETVVVRLKGQIAAIEVVAKVEIPEIPAIMVKEYRDVLINLQKAIEKSKTEAITAIQAL